MRQDTVSSASPPGAKQSLKLDSWEAHVVSHFTSRVPEELLPWHEAKCSWAIRPGLPSLFQEGLGLSNWWAQGHLMSRGPGPVSPVEGTSRTAEGRREPELRWSSPEIGPTSGNARALTLARGEANTSGI